MTAPTYRIRRLIREVRTRWRRRAILRGASIVIGVSCVWGIGLLLLFRVASAGLLTVALAAGIAAVLAVMVRYLVIPATRSISDREIALFVEERMPELEDRLNSAVELEQERGGRRAEAALVDWLVSDAEERARLLPLGAVVPRKREQRLITGSAAALVVFLLLGYASLDDLRLTIASGTLLPSVRPLMSIDPANVEIEQGGSQEIVVSLREETGHVVVLHYQSGEGMWHRSAMEPAISGPSFLHAFTDVQEPIRYYVQHDDERSPVFQISLYTFPQVTDVSVTYHYPRYTGRATFTEAGTGDVRGLKGASVVIDVKTNDTVVDAELEFENRGPIAMARTEDGSFRARFRIEEVDFYRIRLLDSAKKENKFPREYRVTPVEDELPLVSITAPQRDVRANAIEEVVVTARASDDFGLKSVRLRYAVNSGEEKTVALTSGDHPNVADVEGEHVLFLEDYALEPGDVVTYYVEAEDYAHVRPSATDIYFIEIVPFDQDYAQVTGGGAMPGGGQSGVVLSQQQIIAATWKLHREEAAMDREAYLSSARALAQAQENLRLNIEERIGQTTFSLELQRSDDTRRIAELLRGAASAMRNAVQELETLRMRDALKPEREALNNLLKADALNTERRVAMNRDGQAGSSGGATEERMTELMDLELDVDRDKYEMFAPPGRAGEAGAVDDALQRLQELARRQQNLAEQSRRPPQGEDRRRRVERLKRDQDDLRRQAEALADGLSRSAQEPSGRATDAQSQLDRAVQRMRDAERSLREGDFDAARIQQQQAINELDRLTQDLRLSSNEGRRDAIRAMDEAYRRMREQEDRLDDGLSRAMAEARRGRIDGESLEDLAAQRRRLREGLQRLDGQAERLAAGEDSDLASAARNLRQSIRRQALEEEMEASEQALARGWLDSAQRRQDAIRRGLEEMEAAMHGLDGQLAVSEEERIARALERLRHLEQELRALDAAPQGSSETDQAVRGDAARREARIQRTQEQLARLQEELGDMPGAQPLGGIRRALGNADNPNAPLEGEAARAFFNSEVFVPLSQLEEMLRGRLDRIAMERKLRGSRPDDAPAEYRALVEQYYESLSRSGLE